MPTAQTPRVISKRFAAKIGLAGRDRPPQARTRCLLACVAGVLITLLATSGAAQADIGVGGDVIVLDRGLDRIVNSPPYELDPFRQYIPGTVRNLLRPAGQDTIIAGGIADGASDLAVAANSDLFLGNGSKVFRINHVTAETELAIDLAPLVIDGLAFEPSGSLLVLSGSTLYRTTLGGGTPIVVASGGNVRGDSTLLVRGDGVIVLFRAGDVTALSPEDGTQILLPLSGCHQVGLDKHDNLICHTQSASIYPPDWIARYDASTNTWVDTSPLGEVHYGEFAEPVGTIAGSRGFYFFVRHETPQCQNLCNSWTNSFALFRTPTDPAGVVVQSSPKWPGTGPRRLLRLPTHDLDGDDVEDEIDNCPAVYNPEQLDRDSDGVGDECNDASDTDGDEWADIRDNCPAIPNADQADADHNGVGDACNQAEDADHDGWADALDNCPQVVNRSQLDSDHDHLGDACDPFPANPDNEQAQCDNDRSVLQAQLDAAQGEVVRLHGVINGLQAQLDACQGSGSSLVCQADLSGDGIVNFKDLGLFKSVFYKKCEPTP